MKILTLSIALLMTATSLDAVVAMDPPLDQDTPQKERARAIARKVWDVMAQQGLRRPTPEEEQASLYNQQPSEPNNTPVMRTGAGAPDEERS